MRLSTVLLAGCSLVLGSCGSWEAGGTYPGTAEDDRPVSMKEFSRYNVSRTDSVILPTMFGGLDPLAGVSFTWDGADKSRVLAPRFFDAPETQRLFEMRIDQYMQKTGAPDFLSAVYDAYLRMPYDGTTQGHRRPYRCLRDWGSLYYPPIRSLDRPLSFYHSPFTEPFQPDTTSPYFDPEFQKKLDQETGTVLTSGNTLRALFNGVTSYPEKLRMASQARHLLYVAVMTMVADSTSRDLMRVMVERKRAGVDVRLITDDFYTFSVSNFAVGVLEQEGIPVAHVDDKRFNQIDRMFHNKIWIRDGEEAILGGMNVLDYENQSDGFNFMNRDTDILVGGPAATSLLESFIGLWRRYDREGRSIAYGDSILQARLAAERAAGVRGSEHYAQWLSDPATRMNGICRTAVQGDNAEPQNIRSLVSRYVEAARHSIYMTSPGFEFDLEGSEPIDALAREINARARDDSMSVSLVSNGNDGGWGESVIFLRSRVRDSQLVGDELWEDILTPIIDYAGREVAIGTRRVLQPLIKNGVQGYLYCNYIHAKEFYFDRTLTGIASWNFDKFSASNNHESAIFCLDNSLRKQMERQMVLDMINSVPIIPVYPEF
jgi:phosphatidylserine/phosphatidylglycerophosphate/cardiolipin synthase-like enzyme